MRTGTEMSRHKWCYLLARTKNNNYDKNPKLWKRNTMTVIFQISLVQSFTNIIGSVCMYVCLFPKF